ncbi:MAG: hypothetical protein LBL26_04285 [Peptococcaceae bacterium]|jgi:hypothetical protein|nr:hypothetical protein [Peptococcaceae bacterium]
MSESPYSVFHDFTSDNIDCVITEAHPGNYVLGSVALFNGDKTFLVKYVGRSDSDVHSKLKMHLNDIRFGKIKKFAFQYADSPNEAFERECMDYHRYGESQELMNGGHPGKPQGSYRKCPICHELLNLGE